MAFNCQQFDPCRGNELISFVRRSERANGHVISQSGNVCIGTSPGSFDEEFRYCNNDYTYDFIMCVFRFEFQQKFDHLAYSTQ